MRKMIIACIVLALAFVVVPVAVAGRGNEPLAAINVDRLVESIRLVENTRADHIGRAGERSPWQITPEVWRKYSHEPLWVASSSDPLHRSEQRRVAREHVLWIIAQIDASTRLMLDVETVGTIYN